MKEKKTPKKLSEYNRKNSAWISKFIDKIIDEFKNKKTYAEVADVVYEKTKKWKLKDRLFAFMLLGFWIGKRKQMEYIQKFMFSPGMKKLIEDLTREMANEE